MGKSAKQSIQNIFKIGTMVLIVNIFGLTTQYIVDNHTADQRQSVAEYTNRLIKGKLLPMVFVLADRLHE